MDILETQELGLKRKCSNCNTKFYDFNKFPIICPSCGTEYNLDNLLKSRRGRTPSKYLTPAIDKEKKKIEENNNLEGELIDNQNENNLENDIIGEDVIGEDVDNFEEDNDISSNQDFIEANKDSFDDEENSENVSSTEFIDILENESEIDEENEIDDQINIKDKNKDNEE